MNTSLTSKTLSERCEGEHKGREISQDTINRRFVEKMGVSTEKEVQYGLRKS